MSLAIRWLPLRKAYAALRIRSNATIAAKLFFIGNSWKNERETCVIGAYWLSDGDLSRGCRHEGGQSNGDWTWKSSVQKPVPASRCASTRNHQPSNSQTRWRHTWTTRPDRLNNTRASRKGALSCSYNALRAPRSVPRTEDSSYLARLRVVPQSGVFKLTTDIEQLKSICSSRLG